MNNQIVKIVFDYEKGKLRAQAHDGGWVRFPNHLRVRGATYMVETLKKGTAGSWIAAGKISQVQVAGQVSYR